MKKYILALILLASTAPAATTATLTISGTVAPILYIGFDTAGLVLTNSVTLTSAQITGGFTNIAAGTVYEVTNDASHNYSVTVTSANAGKLKHTVVPLNTIAYTMTYGTLFSNNTLTAPVINTVTTSSITSLTTLSRSVTISSTGNANAISGAYSDTVTFTVTAL